MKVQLTPSEFKILLQAIRSNYEKKLKEANKAIPGQEDAYYGFHDFKNTPDTLAHSIENHPKVKSFLVSRRVNGRDLYDRMRKFEYAPKENPVTELRTIYKKVYFLYLGLEDVDAFRQTYIAQIDENSIRLKGYYYSVLKFQVEELDLILESAGTVIKAREKGFHDDKYKDKWLTGDGELINGCLYLMLKNPEIGFMSMAVHVRDKDWQTAPFLLGMLMTQTSVAKHPVSAVVFLTNTNHPFGEEDILKIKRFLLLKRSHVRIKDRPYETLDQLEVKRIKSNKISRMAGHSFRIWSYTRRWKIIQTHFSIQDDYRAFLTTSIHGDNERRQTCLLHVSNVLNERLIVSAHPEEGVGNLAYAILEIPNQLVQPFRGVYSTVGMRGQHSTANQIAILIDDSEFEPEVIDNLERLDEILSAKPGVRQIFDKLNDIYRTTEADIRRTMPKKKSDVY